MDPVSAIASVIAIYQLASKISGLCFRYGQGVRRADRDADLVINEIDTFQRYLRTLKGVLAKESLAPNAADRLRNLNEIINGESRALIMYRKDLKDIKIKLVKVKSKGRFKEAIHALSWPLKQEEVSKTLNTLRRFTDAVDRALNVDNNEILREIDNTTKRIQSSLESAESQRKQDGEAFQLSEERQRANEIKEKILDWLAHPDPSEIHEITRRDRNDQAKTGRWFLNGNAFQEFKATPRSVLWLHGDSGCGKSVLCSAIIDETLASQSGDSRTELAYWYFSVTDKKWTTVDNLLRALISQLVLKCPIPPFLLDEWNARKMGREAPSMPDLKQTIQRILAAEASHSYFIIIDALDESDETERADLLGLIRSLTLLEADIHILVTSRTNTIGVEKGMKNLTSFYNITIEARNADPDIWAHVTERLENDDALAKWSPELRQKIKDTFIKDAGGMFRWVECQLQAVRKCRKPAEVRKTLNTLPRNLHEVYARDLAMIDESASQDVLRLLEWLAFPQQKLRIEEAVYMLAVDMESDPPAFDEANRMVDPEDLLKMCGSLIRLDTNAEGRDDMGHIAQVQTLTAAHTSVIDFLKTQPIKIGSKEVFKFSRSKDNDITLTEDNITSYPFARLCVLIWDVFYREVLVSSENVNMTRVNGLVMELFSSPTAILNWVKLFDPDERGEGVDFAVEISQVKPAIYYAAILGLPNIVRTLIQEGNPVDELVGPPFGTPLVAACVRGRTAVASLLLESGADPNLPGHFYYGTPLVVAIEFGWFEIVKLLLSREGVDVNGHRHPRVKATEEVLDSIKEYARLREKNRKGEDEYARCIEIGTQLIKLANEPNTGDWEDKNFRHRIFPSKISNADCEKPPSHSAQCINTEGKGKDNCAISDESGEAFYQNFLIRATAALYKVTWSTESMVYIAVEYGTLEVLEVLLAAGADPNIRGGSYGTALAAACSRDDGEIVRTLLMNGARTDLYWGYFGSPLNLACTSGSIRMVEDLIKAGADVNQLVPEHFSPLYLASSWERADVVKLLLKNGATTDLYTGTTESPLQVASRKGNIEIARILLDAGSDFNRKVDTRATALYSACENRDKKMVELLLAHGANPNIQDCGTRDHALQEACQNGDEDLVSLLLESGARTDGAEFDQGAWIYGSPLIIACAEGSLGIAELLVEAGADHLATNMAGNSALLTTISSHESELKVFEYLIGLGVDPLKGDKRGCNGLHYAARAKKSDVIERMLGYGINVNATDLNGWSPLHWAIASTEASTGIIILLLQSGCDKTMRDKQGRTALDLARLFNRTEETAVLDGTAQAQATSSKDDKSQVSLANSRICDGCSVDHRNCKPESWHHCTACLDFDFCFRCILDKEVIHFKDHEFSNEPA